MMNINNQSDGGRMTKTSKYAYTTGVKVKKLNLNVDGKALTKRMRELGIPVFQRYPSGFRKKKPSFTRE